MVFRDRRFELLTLCILIAAGFALRARGVGELDFWYDEIAMWLYTVSGTPSTPLEPPLMSWLLLSVMWLVDATGPLVIHLVPMVLAVLTIPVAWIGGRLADGRASTGWIAAVLLTISPMSIYYAREGRPYALFILLSAALFLVFLAAHRRNSPRLWSLMAVLLALCGLTHLLTAQIVAVLAIFSVLYALLLDSTPERLSRLVRSWLAIGAGSLAGSSWGVARYLESSGSANAMGQAFTGAYGFGAENYLRTVLVSFGPGPVQNRIGELAAADAIAAGFLVLFALGMRRLYVEGQKQLVLFAAVLFPIPLLINYSSVGIASGWDWVRYVSHLLLPFLIVVAVGLQALTTLLPAKRLQLGLAALLFVAILPGALRLQVRTEYQQYRDTAGYLDRHAGALQGVIVLSVLHDIGRADERILNIYYQRKGEQLPVYALTNGTLRKVVLVAGRVGRYATEGAAAETGILSGRYALLWRRPVTDCGLVSSWVRNRGLTSAQPVAADRVPPGMTTCDLNFQN